MGAVHIFLCKLAEMGGKAVIQLALVHRGKPCSQPGSVGQRSYDVMCFGSPRSDRVGSQVSGFGTFAEQGHDRTHAALHAIGQTVVHIVSIAVGVGAIPPVDLRVAVLLGIHLDHVVHPLVVTPLRAVHTFVYHPDGVIRRFLDNTTANARHRILRTDGLQKLLDGILSGNDVIVEHDVVVARGEER